VATAGSVFGQGFQGGLRGSVKDAGGVPLPGLRVTLSITAGNAAVGRAGDVRPSVLQVGTLRLDPARHRVHRGDTEITLTPREFGVLEHLMRHAGEVVTKTDILRAVWDAHYEGEVNVVEVYVGYLRRKLGAELVQTVRGAGYRLMQR
jgi:DNA-binding response OmpR family regulator